MDDIMNMYPDVMSSLVTYISGWINQSPGIISTLWRANTYTTHKMMVVWVLDVAISCMALVIACTTGIGFFSLSYYLPRC